MTEVPAGTVPEYRLKWYGLALLTAAYSCHLIDRAIISAVVEPLRAEFNLSDTSLGLITGPAYAAAYALATLPIAWLIDRTVRVKLLAILLALWSAMTGIAAFAQGFWSLFFSRMAVGAAESGGAPTALSLIADMFPPQKRASAVGLFYLSASFGIAASFLIGTFVAANWGWRAAFLVAGVPGLIISLIIWLTLPEPRRGATDDTLPDGQAQETPPFSAALKACRTPALLHLIAAITLNALVIASLWNWAPSLLIRVHDLTLPQAGIVIAVGAGLFQAAGSALFGVFADWLGKKRSDGLAITALAAALLTSGFGIAMALAPTAGVAIGLLWATAFSAGGFLGPSFGLVLRLTGASIRGRVIAIVQLVSQLLGAGIGPLLTGGLSDWLGGGASLRYAVAATFVVSLLAALHFTLTARLIRKDRVNANLGEDALHHA